MSSDKIILNGLLFHGRHGCHPAELELGQKFRVSVELTADLREASTSDDLDKTVDWGGVYQDIRDIVEGRSFHLTEALAQEIAQTMLAHDRVQEVKVRVEKIHAPIPGPFEALGVEIVRRRVNESMGKENQ
jgi:dihydroneopterin aldolase